MHALEKLEARGMRVEALHTTYNMLRLAALVIRDADGRTLNVLLAEPEGDDMAQVLTDYALEVRPRGEAEEVPA